VLSESDISLGETATWLRLVTRHVIEAFLGTLAVSHGWKKLYLISPWISDLPIECGLSLSQLLKGLKDYGTTAYVVTRPPVQEHDWHQEAVDRFAASGMASVVFVPELHTKLYCAYTSYGGFALLGSANLTVNSLRNQEIGVVVRERGAGKTLFRRLISEAAAIYRSPSRSVVCERRFQIRGR